MLMLTNLWLLTDLNTISINITPPHIPYNIPCEFTHYLISPALTSSNPSSPHFTHLISLTTSLTRSLPSPHLTSCAFALQEMTITQLKSLVSKVTTAIKECQDERVLCEQDRKLFLTRIGNIIHDSVPISKDEVYL